MASMDDYHSIDLSQICSAQEGIDRINAVTAIWMTAFRHMAGTAEFTIRIHIHGANEERLQVDVDHQSFDTEAIFPDIVAKIGDLLRDAGPEAEQNKGLGLHTGSLCQIHFFDISNYNSGNLMDVDRNKVR